MIPAHALQTPPINTHHASDRVKTPTPTLQHSVLPNIIKAKKKEVAVKEPSDYGVDISPRLEVVKTAEPATRSAGVKVGSVAELVSKLKEAGVL